MKILSRKSPSTKETSALESVGPGALRRIEITVEREIVSVLVRGRQPAGLEEAATAPQGQGSLAGDLKAQG